MIVRKGLRYTGAQVIHLLKTAKIPFEITDAGGFLTETNNRIGQYQRSKTISSVSFDLFDAQEVQDEINYHNSKQR